MRQSWPQIRRQELSTSRVFPTQLSTQPEHAIGPGVDDEWPLFFTVVSSRSTPVDPADAQMSKILAPLRPAEVGRASRLAKIIGFMKVKLHRQ